MKLPNGYGSCYKLSDTRRRKPYVVKVPSGKYTENGNSIKIILGYFKTKAEGLAALAEYHKQPFNTDKITINEAIDKIIEHRKLGHRTILNYRAVFNKYVKNSIGNTRLCDIKLQLFQDLLNTITNNGGLKCKELLSMVEQYAYEFEYIQKSFRGFLVFKKPEQKKIRLPLTPEEITIIHNTDEYGAHVAMMYLYTGLRLNELIELKPENIHLDEDIPYIVGGLKTAAGKNRVIPIHPRVLPIFKKYYPDLITQVYKDNHKLSSYLTKLLGVHHTAHELRHTFRTELDRVRADLISVDKIMGHTTSGVGISVYTHKTVDDLYAEICKINYSQVGTIS